jgi:hypothetical protein
MAKRPNSVRAEAAVLRAEAKKARPAAAAQASDDLETPERAAARYQEWWLAETKVSERLRRENQKLRDLMTTIRTVAGIEPRDQFHDDIPF